VYSGYAPADRVHLPSLPSFAKYAEPENRNDDEEGHGSGCNPTAKGTDFHVPYSFYCIRHTVRPKRLFILAKNLSPILKKTHTPGEIGVSLKIATCCNPSGIRGGMEPPCRVRHRAFARALPYLKIEMKIEDVMLVTRRVVSVVW
jgi:hypothetical protein